MATHDSMPEIRDVPGYEGYGASADGRVWCRLQRGGPGRRRKVGKKWREVRQVIAPGGYRQISVTRNGRVTTPRVHKLVLAAFVGPRPEGLGCRHLDGNPANNRLDNLVWGTPKENMADKWAHGTMHHGNTHYKAKLTAEKVREVRRMLAAGMTQAGIAARMGVSEPTVGAVATGRNWKHVK